MLIVDEQNPRAVALRDRLLPHGLAEVGGPDRVVVIGGDGYLLQTVARLGLSRRYVGLNAGHLGFLLNDVDDPARVAALLRADRVTSRRFPVLVAEAWRNGERVARDYALNDVYLERMTAQTARMRLSINGSVVVDALMADGIIFSTPMGSTAYSLSAGGPAMHPDVPALSVTPICPHQPKLSPLVLPSSTAVSVEAWMPAHRPVRCVVDGRTIDHIERVEVCLGPESAELGFLEGHDPTARLVTKLSR